MKPKQTGSIVAPGEGRTLPGILFKVAADQAAGSFSIVEHPARVLLASEMRDPRQSESGSSQALQGPPRLV